MIRRKWKNTNIVDASARCRGDVSPTIELKCRKKMNYRDNFHLEWHFSHFIPKAAKAFGADAVKAAAGWTEDRFNDGRLPTSNYNISI
jgi:hypothetical protein